MKDGQLTSLLGPVLAQFDLELESLDSVPAGKRRLLRITVDGDGPEGRGPTLDDIAEATRAISASLDEADVMGASAYTLEVSSRGISRPLNAAKHWRRNRGRLVRVELGSGPPVSGRIVASDDTGATLEVVADAKRGTLVERAVAYAEIVRAQVQVELNRKADEEDED